MSLFAGWKHCAHHPCAPILHFAIQSRAMPPIARQPPDYSSNDSNLRPPKITRYATTLNPKAEPGLQRWRWSARRQPVVQAQILVVQDLLCGNSSEKGPYYREKGPGVQGKRWPKYRYCFSCLKVRGGSPPSNKTFAI